MQATLIQLSATRPQRSAAAAAVAVLLCAAMLVWPYATVQGTAAPSFMPIFVTSATLAEGLTAYLLWTQYRVWGRFIFAVLASGYAFASVTAAAHLAVYPGVFSPTGLFGAGDQTSIWLWLLWRVAFALFVTASLATRSRAPIGSHEGRNRRGALTIWGSVGLSIVLCAAAVAARGVLPNLVSDGGAYRHLTAGPVALSVSAIGLAALGIYVSVTRLRTLMDLWLAIALLAGVIDVTLTLGSGARYSVGWYAARIASMISANAVLGMLMSETSRTYRQLADAHRSLQAVSVRDGLTGVFNRAYFDERYPRELALARAAGYPLSLLIVDVDHFKDYNDAFGHLAGDECLRRIARTLGAALTRQTDFIARYGGEEFVVVLPACDPRVGAITAERLRQAVADMKLPGPSERTPYVTISIGHASSRSHAEPDCATLLAGADAALYAAKAFGRNRVEHEQVG